MKKSNVILTMVTALVTLFYLHSTPLMAQNWAWANSMGGSGSNDFAEGTCTDRSGNIYVIGTFHSSSMQIGSVTLQNHHNANPAANDIFLVKYSPNGMLLWAKGYGGPITEWGHDVACDDSGNIFICGTYGSNSIDFGNGVTVSNNGAMLNYFVAKIGSDGTARWVRTAKPETSCQAKCLAVAGDGDVYVIGQIGALATVFNNPLDSLYYDNSRSDNNFMVVFSNNGTFKSFHRVEGDIIGTTGEGGINDMVITAQKIIYVVGEMADPLDFTWEKDLFVAKYGSNGGIIWRRNYGNDGDEKGYGVTTDAGGNVYITGSFDSDTIAFGSYELYGAVHNTWNRFAAKLNGNGDLLWAKRLNNSGPAEGYSIAADAGGNVYVGGYGIDTLLFSVPVAYPDVCIQKLSSNGAVLWTAKAGNGFAGGTMDAAQSIAIDPSGNLVAAGAFWGPGTKFGGISLTEFALGDAFIAKMGSGSGGPGGVSGLAQLTMQVYPNPASDAIYLRTTGEVHYRLYDVNGRICLQGIPEADGAIRINHLASGVYRLVAEDSYHKLNGFKVVKP